MILPDDKEPPAPEGTTAHRQWYIANETRASSLKEQIAAGMDLQSKDMEWLAWWEEYTKKRPGPEAFPKHTTMVVGKDKDPMK
jgi:hypothetical protein